MWRSLLWKAWREHRWRALGVLLTHLAFVMLVFVCFRKAGDGPEITAGCFMTLAAVLPGFIAIGTVTGERSARTLLTLQTLPVPVAASFGMTWVAGWLTLVAPMVVAEVVTWYGLFDPTKSTPYSWMGDIGADFPSLLRASVSIATVMYALTVAAAVRRRTEAQVALVAVAILLTGGCISGLLSDPDHAAARRLAFVLAPLGAGIIRREDLDASWKVLLAAQAIWVATLACWALIRFPGPVDDRRGAAAPGRPLLPVLPYPRQWPVMWKTWREVGWMCGLYAQLALVIVLALAAGIAFQEHGRSAYSFERPRPLEPDLWMTVFTLAAGFVVIAVGVEIGMGDFERRVDRFFLSRPVPAGAYFWKRFTLGWVWVLAATAIPAAVAWVLASWNRTYSPAMGQPAWLPGGGLRESARIQAGDFLVYVVPAFSLLYAGAVAAAAFLRWRVAAMILSLALPFGHYLLLAVLGHYLPVADDWYRHIFGPTPDARYIAAYTAWLLLCTWLTAAFAAACHRHDWRHTLEERLHGRRITPAVR
jgi:hypothetical protein